MTDANDLSIRDAVTRAMQEHPELRGWSEVSVSDPDSLRASVMLLGPENHNRSFHGFVRRDALGLAEDARVLATAAAAWCRGIAYAERGVVLAVRSAGCDVPGDASIAEAMAALLERFSEVANERYETGRRDALAAAQENT